MRCLLTERLTPLLFSDLARVTVFARTILLAALLSPVAVLSDELAGHPTWLALLHHDRTDLLGNTRSAVVSSDFFFSPNGSKDPSAELQRTRAMLEADPAQYADNEHPLCRFPARAMWLKNQGFVDADLHAECSSLTEWLGANDNSRVGLVFANGYLGNPASFFGHLLLHISPDGLLASEHASLLEKSINFGADVPASDGLLRYMALGVTGGYTATFSETLFYRNSQVYAERQMRDLWLYYLNLEQDQIDFLIKHLWELRGVEFTYLFLTENCASRIGRLIELTTSREVLPANPLWVAPEAIILSLMAEASAETPLLREGIHLPSRRSKAEHKYRSLSLDERRAAHAVWPNREEIDLDAQAFLSLRESSRAALLDSLLSHLLYLRYTDPELDVAQVQRRLLAARLDLPQSQYIVENAPPPVPVHQMKPPSYLGAAGIIRTGGEFGMAVKGRAAQYDLLSGESARMPYSALEIFSFDLEWFDETQVKLNDITLFSVTSLTPVPHRLPGGRRLSWHASLAWRETSLLSDDRVWQGELLAGKSALFRDHLVYGLVGLGAHARSTLDEALGLTVRGGILTNWDPRLRTDMFVSERFAREDPRNSGAQLAIHGRYGLAPRMDLAFEIEMDRDNQKGLIGILRYF